MHGLPSIKIVTKCLTECVEQKKQNCTSVQVNSTGAFTFGRRECEWPAGRCEPFKAYWLRDAPTGLTFNNCTLCPRCIYVFCIYLRTNSDLCHIQHKLIGFYNRDEKCLQRGTDWVFKKKQSAIRL